MILGDSQLVVGADMLVIAYDRIVSPGRITLRDGKISDARQGSDGCDVYLNGSALLPGLINAHTHLEFSDLAAPLPAGDSFPQWIGKVVAHRREQESAGEEVYRRQRRAAIRQGAAELYRAGTALAADIVTEPWSASDYGGDCQWMDDTLAHDWASRIVTSEDVTTKLRHLPQAHANIIAMPEVIGLDEDRIAATSAWARQCIQIEAGEHLHSVGLSPHSPYSVLMNFVCEALKSMPDHTTVAMHLAESQEELEWLAQRKGPFRAAFERIGVEAPSRLPTIDDCLRLLQTRRSLVVHGNYLSEEQMQYIANTEQMSVVYCPRTHDYFGHSQYPLKELLQLGVRVAFGTDSRASNPDLDLWEELRFARQQHPWLLPKQVIAMATTGAAEALGVSGQYGALDVGYEAHAFVTPLSEDDTAKRLFERLTSISSSNPRIATLPDLIYKLV